MSALLMAGALYALSCKAAPQVRPVKMGPVDAGPASVEAVRRQLQGTWELTTLVLFTPGGEPSVVEATGRLQYDEYGNLSMRGNVAGGQTLDPSVLNLSGRVAIDPAKHTLKFEGITAANADDKRIDPQLDASRVRHYEFIGDVLKTSIASASGSTTATATWKKIN